jgi:hypothetical protein
MERSAAVPGDMPFERKAAPFYRFFGFLCERPDRIVVRFEHDPGSFMEQSDSAAVVRFRKEVFTEQARLFFAGGRRTHLNFRLL